MGYPTTIFFVAIYFVSAFFRSQPDCNHKQIKNNEAPPISKVSYSSSGGRSGNYESLDISPASVIYVQGRRGVEKSIKEKTVTSFWNKLTKAINLSDFDKIRSNPGHALYDGIDITISIEKGKEKHSIINGNEDTMNYRRISPFTDMLEDRLAKLRQKIIW